jgi:hypothetical protein
MSTTRRDFVTRMAATAVIGSLPLSLDPRSLGAMPVPTPNAAPEKWDLSWTGRLTGKYKAVFDVPEIDSGYGVWRASIWGKQYMETLGVPAKDLSAVLVLRHTGIFLAMQQSFWDKYGIGADKKAMHPLTMAATDRNPALLSAERQELPPQLDGVALDQFIKRGGIVLACNLALDEVVATITKKDNVSAEDARKQAIAALVPGVILQPSGVFAALHAQDVGCKYLRAS